MDMTELDASLQALSAFRPTLEKWAAGHAKARSDMTDLMGEALMEGATLRQVATASGYSHQRVHQILQAAL